ncbi:uncharacterized protein [Dysidea avara]|uniref:uncharacterized protein n=1 Tax=Dysidea avara TaxID=196820 RepID=UPI00331CA83D
MTECEGNKICRDYIACNAKCLDQWDEDNTTQKFQVQNCANICQFSLYDKTIDKYMRCVTEHNCISLPLIPNTCRTSIVKPVKQLSVKDLDGYWWVVRGYHKVYDCYPCQHTHFQAINDNSWEYAPSYVVPLANGSHAVISQKFQMPVAPAGQKISFKYYDAGLLHYETWWLLDKAEDGSYVTAYYCGNTMNWNYEGAIVMARNTSIPTNDYGKISMSFKTAVGLDLSEFCQDDVMNCENLKTN